MRKSKQLILKPIPIVVLLSVFFLEGFTAKPSGGNRPPLSQEDCITCDRLSLFYKARNLIGASIWNNLNDTAFTPPVLYFTDSFTYAAFANDALLNQSEYTWVYCKTGIWLKRMKGRLDKQVFHMENKMNFEDTSSPYYFRPVMLCSDVETMHRFVPDFETTEEWLQLVMHEYFHSFQFSHGRVIRYLADTIQIGADTLDKIFVNEEWFRQEIMKENRLLLLALGTKNDDSLDRYIREFSLLRNSRRSRYMDTSDFDLAAAEDFWETIEGTARYTEYYMALHFGDISTDELEECDSLFRHFKGYAGAGDLEVSEEFVQRTLVTTPYYYATGFNLCRLMDKLGYTYKEDIWSQSLIALYPYLLNHTR